VKYKEWLAELDDVFMSTIGLTHRDVEDYTWIKLYEQDHSPLQAYDVWAESNPEFFSGT
jgi:hypothetical protein